MGCLLGKPEENDSTEISRKIDGQIKKEAKERYREVKLLLLGIYCIYLSCFSNIIRNRRVREKYDS